MYVVLPITFFLFSKKLLIITQPLPFSTKNLSLTQSKGPPLEKKICVSQKSMTFITPKMAFLLSGKLIAIYKQNKTTKK